MVFSIKAEPHKLGQKLRAHCTGIEPLERFTLMGVCLTEILAQKGSWKSEYGLRI